MKQSIIKTWDLRPLWAALAGASASLAFFTLTSDALDQPETYARVSQIARAPARPQLMTTEVTKPHVRIHAQRRAHGHGTTPVPTEAPSESDAPAVSTVPFVADMDFTQDVATGAEPQHTALLRINSRPWAQLYLDGRLIGTTPQLALRVAPGEHSIRLVNEAFAMSRSFRVELAAGESVSRVETLDE